MNQANLITDGVQLMLVGMGMVFVFLSILVICTHLMQKLFKPLTPEQKSASNNQAITDEEISAITAAIHLFRNKNKD